MADVVILQGIFGTVSIVLLPPSCLLLLWPLY